MNRQKNAALDASRLESIAMAYEIAPNARRLTVAGTLRDVAARLRGGGCERCECTNPGLGGTAHVLHCRDCVCHKQSENHQEKT